MVISEEKRKSERIKYYHTLSYRLFLEKNFPLPERFLRTAGILDISSGGIRIRTLGTESNFDIGSILLLNVPPPNMPVTLSLLGKVRLIKLESHRHAK